MGSDTLIDYLERAIEQARRAWRNGIIRFDYSWRKTSLFSAGTDVRSTGANTLPVKAEGKEK